MLERLLNCPKHPERANYIFLPVSTSYEQELERLSHQLLADSRKRMQPAQSSNEFIANERGEDVRDELVMLKLKGYIDQKDITGKGTEMKKLPSKVQVGRVIEGDPIVASKIRLQKREKGFTDYFLELDKEKAFTRRKFTELQKLNQRKKKMKKRIIAKKQKPKK